MQITFYYFNKRLNSTAQPNPLQGAVKTCQLKSSTSIFNPIIIVKDIPTNWSPLWNYCEIPEFQRYYFVNNWTWLNGVWECSLSCDVLASFKTPIGNLSEYVLRSSYESDGNIVDSAYLTKTQVQTHMTLLPEFFIRVMTSGFYIVGIIGREDQATQGAITYYQMSAEQLARLRAYLLSDDFLTEQGLTDLVDFVPADATKVIYNPYQYIVSCMWFPFDMSAISDDFKTETDLIYFGWWSTETAFTCYRIDDNAPRYYRSENIAITNHPQITRGNYLNHSPYTSRVLRFSPFSEVQIPDEYLESGDHITLELGCDFITGIGMLLIHTRDAQNNEKMLITRLTEKIGVDIQLAQVGTDFLGAQTQMVNDNANFYSGIVKTATSFDLLHPISSSLNVGSELGASIAMYEYNGLNNYLNARAPKLLTSGVNGSLISLAQNNYLCETFYILVDEDNTQLGRPLCKIKTLNTIPGYIVVLSPDVNIACFAVEKQMITTFLQTGFFYE